ncbi:hypothetical protein NBRC111894_364 [Sporolactobacillus inulinus]|uniref:Uncharacterized protein n=1 Tax=Sporolactobacillus inulinus TaxID=2078 RepID=A0A4Y1Z714_9BACL|nr:hypothetical protein NBRC111894_364 [Sporolactobacillus inulinus]
MQAFVYKQVRKGPDRPRQASNRSVHKRIEMYDGRVKDMTAMEHLVNSRVRDIQISGIRQFLIK